MFSKVVLFLVISRHNAQVNDQPSIYKSRREKIFSHMLSGNLLHMAAPKIPLFADIGILFNPLTKSEIESIFIDIEFLADCSNISSSHYQLLLVLKC